MGTKCKFCECIKTSSPKRRKNKECPNHLENWEKWLGERKGMQEILKRKTGRSQGELLMNLSEELRMIQEEKMLFAYSRINTNFDRLRGNPEFWKLPAGLAKKIPDLRDPIYFSIKTKEERNEIPQIEYIGIPNQILDERNVLPRTRNIYNKWKNSAYRNARLEKLASKLSLVQPHKPDISELIVSGKKLILNDTMKAIKASTKDDSPEHDQHLFSHERISFEVHKIPSISFSINRVEFSDENSLTSNTRTIRIIFETEGLPDTPEAKKVTFENKGLKTLRFYWHKIEQFRTFRDIAPIHPHATAFYFDKTEVLLVPGRVFQVPIWFKPKKMGHYTECWEITTSPKLWREDFKFIVRLQGFVTDKEFGKKCKAVKDMLDSNMRNTLIKDILNKSLIEIRYAATEPLIFSFSEKEIFEAANQEIIGVTKRPKYLYNQCLMNELKEIYKSVRIDDGETWDYSIEKLKVLARKRDVVEYVEELTENCTRSKSRFRELSNTGEKSESGPGIEPGGVQSRAVGNNYKNLQLLLHELERPGMIPNKEREKFLHAYFIMGTHFSKMCAALDSLDGGTSDALKSYQPFYDFRKISAIKNLPSRLIIETFDDVWVQRTKRAPPEPQTGFTMSSKPRVLENIPPEDTTAVFHTYFKKSSQNKSQNKVTKSVQKQSALISDNRMKSKQVSSSKVIQNYIHGPVRENFDPFEDIQFACPYPADTLDKYPSSSYAVPKFTEKRPRYDYKKYLIIYTSLCSAVDAIVAAIETLKECVVPLETLAAVSKLQETKITAESKNINRSSKDDSYFRYLLDVHLTSNRATNEYFIHGRTIPAIDEFSVQEEEPSMDEELPNLFKSHETIILEPNESRSTMVTQCVQTSCADVDFNVTSEDLVDVESLESHSEQENIEESEKSSDIFYVMDDIER